MKLIVGLLLFVAVSYCQNIDTETLRKSLEHATELKNLSGTELSAMMSFALKSFYNNLLDGDGDCTSQFADLQNYEYETKLPGGLSASYKSLYVAIDAFGKPSSGILRGAVDFRGAFDECLSIKVNFTMQYCLSHLIFGTQEINFQLPFFEALCIPASCNENDVGRALNITTELLYERFKAYLLLDNSETIGFRCTSQEKLPFSPGAKAMIALSCLLVVLVIIGTSVDWVIQVYETLKYEHHYGNSINGDHQYNRFQGNEIDEKATLLAVNRGQPKQPASTKLSRFLYDLIVSFSLYKTVPAIMSTHQPPSAISCINGLRVISMFWVIMGHVYGFSLSIASLDNTLDLIDFVKRFTAQPILNGFFSVDTFFFLSGLLVSYLTLREMKRRNGCFPFLTYYLHRYLRLTPTYMFVLFFIWALSIYMGNGPTFQSNMQAVSGYCKSYWWTNLLYINNFHPSDFSKECMGWAWYLADDMQFFVISPLLLIPLYHWLPAGLIAVAVLLAASIGVTGFIAGYYGFPANLFAPILFGTDIRPTNFPDEFSEIYGKPYCRISPYLVGIILGYVFFKNYRFKFHRVVNLFIYLLLWAMAIVFGMSTVYGLYSSFNGHYLTVTENVMYFMFSRLTWGLALAQLAFCCHYGYGGVINRFLSLPFWVPLSRLTFTAYLVHPAVIFVLYSSLRHDLHFDTNTMVVYTIACCVLSYGVAGVVSVFVEFPLSNVEMTLFKLFGIKRGESKQVREN